MAKRGNGEGSIIKRNDGRWMGSITTGRDVNGKIIRKTVYGKTRKEVQEKLSVLSGKLYSKTYLEPSTIELKNWLNTWLKNYKAISLKPVTYDLYDSLISTVISPRIGCYKLKDIKPIHIQTLYNTLYDDGEGYSTSTIQKVNAILKPAFEMAIRNELIEKNPVYGVQMPKHKEKQVRALTIEEEAKFLKVAQKKSILCCICGFTRYGVKMW